MKTLRVAALAGLVAVSVVATLLGMSASAARSSGGHSAATATSADVSYPCDEVRGASKIYDNGNVDAVQNGATAATTFTASSDYRIVEICTYHWNDGQGSPPGTISLKSLTTSKRYGPWKAIGKPGMGGVPNAYWLVKPNVDVPKGRYRIVDSDPETWSQNDGTGNRGMAFVIAKPAAPTWPPLPDAKVPIDTVSNGCGPSSGASTDPRFFDTSSYFDPTVGKTYHVKFRAACDLHDAGYNGAKVTDSLAMGTVDYRPWTRDAVDEKFLKDMRTLCERYITSSRATTALANCKGRGGAASFGAYSRYSAVVNLGMFAWYERTDLTGAWVDPDNPSGQGVAIAQNGRSVRAVWRGGTAYPGLRGEFRGTLVSLDRGNSIVKGSARVDDGTSTTMSVMSITVTYKTRNTLIGVRGPASLPSELVRA